MKNLLSFSAILFLLFSTSCKKEQQNTTETTDQVKQEIKRLIVDTNNSVINWTAYKTTEKIPVKGIFKEVKITNSISASKPEEVLNGLEFEVPVASIFSNDSIRDYKLTTFFFGIMKNTLHLKGTIHSKNNGEGNISLTMNGFTNDLPFTYKVNGNDIEIQSVMNIDTWQAQAAVASLNKVCNFSNDDRRGF